MNQFLYIVLEYKSRFHQSMIFSMDPGMSQNKLCGTDSREMLDYVCNHYCYLTVF